MIFAQGTVRLKSGREAGRFEGMFIKFIIVYGGLKICSTYSLGGGATNFPTSNLQDFSAK